MESNCCHARSGDLPSSERAYKTILEEYKAITLTEEHPPLYHIFNSEDATKNRFSNIIPVAHTRVKLHARPGRSDYINANYVTYGTYTYICTQGPLEETASDFWQMVYEQNSRVIVMLCNLVEKNRIRCHKYWPRIDEVRRYGNVWVKFVKTASMPGVHLRKFHLYYANPNNINDASTLTQRSPDRQVTQLHYTEWPDFGTPYSSCHIRTLVEMFDHYISDSSNTNVNGNSSPYGPGIVHCSAGIGRTGTFVAIHSCLRQLRSMGRCDVRDTVVSLRRQRVGMVQTAEQYVFVYQTLKDAIIAVHRNASPSSSSNSNNVKSNMSSSGTVLLDSSGEAMPPPEPMELDEDGVTEHLLEGRPFNCINPSESGQITQASQLGGRFDYVL